MSRDYVLQPSSNLAERETQVTDYHPSLCFKVAQTHRAYGWSRRHDGGWDAAQIEAYDRGYRA